MVKATSGSGGKGDAYRPVDKKKYDRNWLMFTGDKCPNPNCIDGVDCGHRGVVSDKPQICKTCNGIGYVEKPKVRFEKEKINEQ